MAEPTDFWTLALTSVALGTIVRSVVSSLFGFVSQHLERRARQDELLMKICTDWAVKT